MLARLCGKVQCALRRIYLRWRFMSILEAKGPVLLGDEAGGMGAGAMGTLPVRMPATEPLLVERIRGAAAAAAGLAAALLVEFAAIDGAEGT